MNSHECIVSLADLANYPLPHEIMQELDAYIAAACQQMSIRRYRMEYAVKEAMRDGVTDKVTLIGWAITYDSFGRWLDAERVREDHAFSSSMLILTRRQFSWCAGDAARYLHGEYTGNVITRTVNTLLYRLGLSHTEPLTMNDYYHMIQTYIDTYFERFNRQRTFG